MSDQEKEQQGSSKQQWRNILLDFAILVGIMAVIGFGLKEGMDLFKPVSPSDALIASINDKDASEQPAADTAATDGKAEATGQPSVSKEFITILNKGIEKDAAFVNNPNDNGVTPLMWICYFNVMDPTDLNKIDASRVRYVKYMLEQDGINVAAKDQEGFTALHWAAWSGFSEVCKVLVKAGIPVDDTESNGYSPLALAAMRGNADTVKILLELGANKGLKLKNGSTVYELAEKRAIAYHSSSSPIYTLIYNKARDAAYVKTLDYLK